MSLSSLNRDAHGDNRRETHNDDVDGSTGPGGASVRDIAAAAGVSIGTVSRYLNGRSLLPQTRARVEEGIRKVGERHTPARRHPKLQKTLIIGAVFPNFDQFHVGLLRALEKIVLREGYHVITCDYERDESKMREQFSMLRGRGVDGIVCSPVRSTFGVAYDNLRVGLPVVTFNNRVDAWGNDHISVDDRDAVAKAVSYLVDMDHRRIAYLGGDPETSTGLARLRGYQNALAEAGIEERPEYMLGGKWPSQVSGYTYLHSLFDRDDPPTAMVAANYVLGYSALRYCRDRGVRIPDDLSLISFDETDVFELYTPPITAIRQPLELMAEEAAAILLERIAGGYETYPRHTVVPTEMILRDSVRKLNATT